MKELETETLSFRVDSEQLAMDTIEEYKSKQLQEGYTLTKYNTVYKCKKDRKSGSIISEFWRVTVTKEYNID